MTDTNLGLVERDGKVVVSSRDVARVFEKRHDHVLRDIKNILENDAKWGVPNFGESSYANEQNKQQPEYLITRDGFTLLVMGYTGEKAMGFKKAYIAAFNDMENRLKQPTSIESLIQSPELLLALVTQHIDALQENRRLQLTEAKYTGQCETVSLYRVGEIASELGISAKRLNSFLHDCHVQYRPDGSQTWRLYTEYAGDNIALPRLVTLTNGRELPMLLWTAKGRDFIFDLAEQEQPVWYS
jgi:Rha family phage regulatory protein